MLTEPIASATWSYLSGMEVSENTINSLKDRAKIEAFDRLVEKGYYAITVDHVETDNTCKIEVAVREVLHA